MSHLDEFLVSALELPEEVIRDMPLLTMIGRERITIENYSGLLSVSEQIIELKSSLGKLAICGENLKISFLNKGELGIFGNIERIVVNKQDV